MITVRTISTNSDYKDLRYAILKTMEGEELAVYADSKQIPTIGIGINVREPDNLILVLEAMGYTATQYNATDSTTQTSYFYQLSTLFGTSNTTAAFQAAADAIMARLSASTAVAATNTTQAIAANSHTTFAFANATESQTAFDNIIYTYETRVDVWLANIPQSQERAVLVSLAFNSGNLLGNKLKAAWNAGDRAEAWYEIRYNSNGDSSQGIANRRMAESQIFGLFDNGSSIDSDDIAGALLAYRMYHKHLQKITTYESTYMTALATAQSKVDAVDSSFGTVRTAQDTLKQDGAFDVLNNNYAKMEKVIGSYFLDFLAESGYTGSLKNTNISDIWVASDSIGGTNEVAAHTVDRTADTTNNLIFGNIDNDEAANLANAGGDDSLSGGSGDDIFVGGEGDDTINGNGGEDTILYHKSNDGIVVTLDGSVSTGGDAQGDTLDNIENVIGSDHDDVITGNDSENLIYGGMGDDVIDGSAGNDTLFGSQGNDTILGGAGDDVIDGGFGHDSLDGGEGTDTLIYSEGVYGTWATVNIDGTISIQDQLNYTDTLINFEKIKLTDNDDFLEVKGLSETGLDSLEYIDMGGQSEKGNDVLDLSAIADDLKVEAFGGNKVKISYKNSPDGPSLIVQNVEKIILGNGNNEISGGLNYLLIINAGDGNDVVKNASNMLVDVGGGSNIVHVGQNIGYAGLNNDDRVVYGNVIVNGALRSATSEGPYAIDSATGLQMGLNQGGELVIVDPRTGYETYILDANVDVLSDPSTWTAGISLGEIHTYAGVWTDPDIPSGWMQSNWDLMEILLKRLEVSTSVGGVDPLVLDLDGDGLELSTKTILSPQFDLDGDGFKEPSGWVLPDDGFLAHDINGNGNIDDISELFGGLDQSGLEALAAHDSNADGVIDIHDTVFSELTIWQDLNQNGVTETGELSTLTEIGIQSISLTGTTPVTPIIAGNHIAADGSFTWNDGTVGALHDVHFRVDNFNTTYSGDSTIDPSLVSLPDMSGRGVLTSLHIAMTQNASLRTTIENLTFTASTLADLRAEALPALAEWAGYDGTGTDIPLLIDSNGDVIDFAIKIGNDWGRASGDPVIDAFGVPVDHPTYADVVAMFGRDVTNSVDYLTAEEIAFLEAYLGETINPSAVAAGNTSAISAMTELMDFYIERIDVASVRLAIQTSWGDTYLPGIGYDPVLDNFYGTTNKQLVPALEVIIQNAPAGSTAAADYFAEWDEILEVIIGDYYVNGAEQDNTHGYIFAQLVAAFENVTTSHTLYDIAIAFGVPGDQIIDSSGIISGTTDNDIFYLNGSETVSGGTGYDNYILAANFGNVVINDTETITKGDDILRFAHYNPEDITAVRDGIDMVITVMTTGDTVRLIDQFSSPVPSLFGGDYSDDTGVSSIVFADGTSWNYFDMAKAVSHPTNGDDIFIGTGTVDYLDGGLGNDYLSGGDSADTYVFGDGYGQDIIFEDLNNVLLGNNDALLMKDLSLSDVTFVRNGNSDDLEIHMNYSTDTVTIQGQFQAAYAGIDTYWINRIETIIFTGDNTILSWEDIMVKTVADSKTSGDDIIYGFSYNDILDGGAGNDYLSGGNEFDTYIYGIGYGNDIIEDLNTNILSNTNDTIKFGPGLSQADVSFSRIGSADDLIITLNSTGETLTIKGHFSAANTGVFGIYWKNRIESFEFEDGTLLTAQDIGALLITQDQTSGNDILYGYHNQDTFIGGAGDDILRGGNDGDTYIYNLGDGNDIIMDQQTDVLTDTPDRIVFGAGINPEDLSMRRVGDNLVITITTTSETITVERHFDVNGIGGSYFEIEEFHFANGIIWSSYDIIPLILASTDGDDLIIGSQYADYLDGGLGNDRLEGADRGDTYFFDAGYGHDTIYDFTSNLLIRGTNKLIFGAGIAKNDLIVSRNGDDMIITFEGLTDKLTLEKQFLAYFYHIEIIEFADGTVWSLNDLKALYFGGTDGNDTIYGENGSHDRLSGGLGNDYLSGGSGSDTYVFRAGDGHDTIEDRGASSLDIIEIHGYSPADVRLSKILGTTDGLVISFIGSDDKISIIGTLASMSFNKIEEIHFDDGTVWTLANLAIPNDYLGTNGDDIIYSLPYNENIYGLDGNDIIDGSVGDDNLYGGAGDDWLSGGSGLDYFDGGSGNDTVDFTYSTVAFTADLTLGIVDWGAGYTHEQLVSIENLTGSSGNNILIGDSGDNILDGYVGDDILISGLGNDILIGGLGKDIFKINPASGNNTIKDFDPTSELIYILDTSLSYSDLMFNQSGNNVLVTTISGLWLLIENIIISDIDSSIFIFGETAPINDTIYGTSAHENLYGYDGNDIIYGGAGNDNLYGGAGDDWLSGGTGLDYFDGGSGNDTADFTYSTVAFTADLTLGIVDWGAGYTHEQLVSIENITGSSGNNTLIGDAGNNRLDGHAGNDNLYGGAGDDWLSGGTGLDYFDGGSGNDTVDFTYTSANFTADLTLGTIDWGGGYESMVNIENFTGSSGNNTLIGDSGDNILDGYAGTNIINGGLGNDTLIGGSGTDTFVFDLNWGHDSVIEFTDGIDILDLTATGLTYNDLTISQYGSDTLIEDGFGNSIILQGINASVIDQSDFA